jgi:signal transduction histidine kinase
LASRSQAVAALRRLADQILAAHGLEAVERLLTSALPAALGVASATLLVWNRKLDTFEALSPGDTRAHAVRPDDPGVSAPDARYLISDGQLLETAGGSGDGVLLPLMARGALTGMLVLGPRRGRRQIPYRPIEARGLSVLAARAALALERHLYQRELISSERMAALGSMAGMLAHDFRGPMTVIRGYAETMAEGPLAPHEVQERATTIVEMVDRLERMTTETLDFARGGSTLTARPTELRTFVSDLIHGLEQEQPGLTLVADVNLPAHVSAALDMDKLRRAVGNIAHNAVEAMAAHGRFHISARVTGMEPGGAVDERAGETPLFVLELRDEGPGVPAAIREQVFEPFVTAGKKRGTGLGLAVARRFVEDHGGRLVLLPEGPGARFKIELPTLPVRSEQ